MNINISQPFNICNNYTIQRKIIFPYALNEVKGLKKNSKINTNLRKDTGPIV